MRWTSSSATPCHPAYIKHYEADKAGKVLINPYLQVASKDFPAVLVVKEAPYNWVIDANGNVAIIPEAAHPYGRTYPNGFFRPEDQSVRKPGTRENYGHVSALAGTPGRISGEILFDKDTNTWVINNKSGRYTKHNPDRSPEQLINAATMIREVVDPGKTPWGQVFFLLEYSSDEMRAALLKSPKIQYDDPAKKARPHLIVMGGGATTFKPEEMPKVAAAAPATVAAPAAAAAPQTAARQARQGPQSQGRAERRSVLSLGRCQSTHKESDHDPFKTSGPPGLHRSGLGHGPDERDGAGAGLCHRARFGAARREELPERLRPDQPRRHLQRRHRDPGRYHGQVRDEQGLGMLNLSRRAAHRATCSTWAIRSTTARFPARCC
jgi:hypothetical protein